MTIVMRPIRPGDACALVGLHSRMSEQTRYLRFFTPCPRVPASLLRRFVEVDHHDREAFVAIEGPLIVGVGRYERLTSTEAVVAFVVEDAFQGRGIGSELLTRLAYAARQNGIDRFVGTVLPGNPGILRWIKGYPVEHRWDDGLIQLGFRLDLAPRHGVDDEVVREILEQVRLTR
jgi:GNAT superfamily N-acetyltransferase